MVKSGLGGLISIHAPRGGSDPLYPSQPLPYTYFNPRSPWGERHGGPITKLLSSDFNPRSPWGERPRGRRALSPSANFNPRSPWGERLFLGLFRVLFFIFQSTLPVGGATSLRHAIFRVAKISIHAPRGGSDQIGIQIVQLFGNFNPRSPWGERQQRCTVLGAHLWRRYIIFAHFREIGLSAWAASGESGGKQRSKSRANLPGIFCLPGLRNQRIRGASGI